MSDAPTTEDEMLDLLREIRRELLNIKVTLKSIESETTAQRRMAQRK